MLFVNSTWILSLHDTCSCLLETTTPLIMMMFMRDCGLSPRSRLFFISAVSDFVGFGGRFFISAIWVSVQVGGRFFISASSTSLQTRDSAHLFISAYPPYPHIRTPYPHIRTLAAISAYPPYPHIRTPYPPYPHDFRIFGSN